MFRRQIYTIGITICLYYSENLCVSVLNLSKNNRFFLVGLS